MPPWINIRPTAILYDIKRIKDEKARLKITNLDISEIEVRSKLLIKSNEGNVLI
jgi:hypothetical protein